MLACHLFDLVFGSFFFQAEDGIRDKLVTGVQTFVLLKEEDGIRDKLVTGVQTCALPISPACSAGAALRAQRAAVNAWPGAAAPSRASEYSAPAESGVGSRSATGPRASAEKIGRASCRERV